MKKATLLAVLLIASASLFAQCKYNTNEIDKFTKDTVKITKRSTLIYALNDRGNVFFIKQNSLKYLHLQYFSGGIKSLVIQENAELMFILEDETVLTLKAMNSTYGDVNLNSIGGDNSGVKANYTLSKEDLNLLQTKKIKSVRLYLNDTHKDYNVLPKNAEKIKLSANCI